jgi:hypothetical protein
MSETVSEGSRRSMEKLNSRIWGPKRKESKSISIDSQGQDSNISIAGQGRDFSIFVDIYDYEVGEVELFGEELKQLLKGHTFHVEPEADDRVRRRRFESEFH